MQLPIKLVLSLFLLSSFSFAQLKKEQRKLNQALRKGKCPKLEGSFSNCSLKNFSVDVSDEVKDLYNEISQELSEAWDNDVSEEEKNELGITKQQFLYAGILTLSGYFEYKEIESDEDQIALAKKVTKQEVMKMLTELASKIASDDFKPILESMIKSGELDITWETKLIDGKLTYKTDDDDIFVVGRTTEVDGDDVRVSCTKKKLKLTDGEGTFYYSAAYNDLFLKIKGNFEDTKFKARITCHK